MPNFPLKQLCTVMTALTFSTILAACGGGGGGSASPSATTTSSTATSTSALTGVISGPTNPTTVASSSGGSSTVVLPLEVIGAAGAVVSVQVPAPSGSTATQLYMHVNNLSYDNEAYVKVNDGPWVALTNASVKVQGAGASYGGIGGGFDTIKLTVPVTGGVNGTNTISFQFHQDNGISAGYRVLDFNLEDGSNNQLIASSAFSQDDPTSWVAPDNNAADIAAGKTLWQSATLDASPLNTANLKAHCMDCHTANGSDLQRFNYSNYSIVARSMYHGLNEAQGMQIASYIRSLTATLGVPGPNCRPWNPPYQPGPGLDSGDVKNWTCGAGLDYVSESDMTSLQYIFPNGVTSSAATQAAIAPSGKINLREIPISLQLPDWNHWVPRVAPIDAWGSYFTTSELNLYYNNPNGTTPTTGTGGATPFNINLRSELTTGGSNYAVNKNGANTLFNDLYYWGVALTENFAPSNMGTPAAYTAAQEENLYSTYQWQLTKAWELAQDFNLETYCPVNWTSRGAPKVEARGWCGYGRLAFDVSPHALNFPISSDPAVNMFGTPLVQWTRGNQWYEMQILLNPGNGAHNVHLPVDWQYAYGVFNDLSNQSKRMEPMRNLLYLVKGTQEMDNGVAPTDVAHGWTTRDTSPLDLWKSGQSGIWAGVPRATEVAIVDAFLENWVSVSNSYNLSTWQRLPDSPSDGLGGNPASGELTCGISIRSLCYPNYVPNTLYGADTSTANFPSYAFNQIPLMKSEGINTASFQAWLANAYPRGNFASE
jgi:hypothetical protein